MNIQIKLFDSANRLTDNETDGGVLHHRCMDTWFMTQYIYQISIKGCKQNLLFYNVYQVVKTYDKC